MVELALLCKVRVYSNSMEIFAQGLPVPNCPFCGEVYEAASKTVIEASAKDEVLHVTCLCCGRSLVLAIARSAAKVRSVGMLTDCNAHDYARFRKEHRVTLDDVLAVHERLQK